MGIALWSLVDLVFDHSQDVSSCVQICLFGKPPIMKMLDCCLKSWLNDPKSSFSLNPASWCNTYAHRRHCKPLLCADADVFCINVKPHSITHREVVIRMWPANLGEANVHIGFSKNTLGFVSWLTAPSASPQERTHSYHGCPFCMTSHVCGIYGVKPLAPQPPYIFGCAPFSHFSHAWICISVITFLFCFCRDF